MISRSLLQRRVPPLSRCISSTATRRSHIGSAPIPYPPTLTLAPSPTALTLTGPKGTYSLPLPPFVQLAINNPQTPNHIVVSVLDSEIKHQRATWGLTRALIANAVRGLTEGFEVPLRLVGVGYRAAVEPDPTVQGAERLRLKLGFAHDVVINVPSGVKAEVPAPTKIMLKGTDKHVLGLFAAKIRKWRKPEPYKGKVRTEPCSYICIANTNAYFNREYS